jgi:hypothetical protein
MEEPKQSLEAMPRGFGFASIVKDKDNNANKKATGCDSVAFLSLLQFLASSNKFLRYATCFFSFFCYNGNTINAKGE